MTSAKNSDVIARLVGKTKDLGFEWLEDAVLNAEGEEALLLRKARAKYTKDVYSYFQEGIEKFLVRFGFSKSTHKYWISPTFFGWAAIHLAPTGKDSYIKLIVARTFEQITLEEMMNQLKFKRRLPQTDYYRQLNLMMPPENWDECFDVLRNWRDRETRLTLITDAIERCAFPIFCVPDGDEIAAFQRNCDVIAKEVMDESYDIHGGSYADRISKLLDTYRKPTKSWDFVNKSKRNGVGSKKSDD